MSKARVGEVLSEVTNSLAAEKLKRDDPLKSAVAGALSAAASVLRNLGEEIDGSAIAAVEAVMLSVNTSHLTEHPTFAPRWSDLAASLAKLRAEVSMPPLEDNADVVST